MKSYKNFTICFLLVVSFTNIQAATVAPDTAGIKLSETEKYKIRLEEKYRYEVQKSLGDKEDKSLTLNSPFTLWFLSAVFISGGTYVFNFFKARRERRKGIQERLRKLIIEIQSRYLAFKSQIDNKKRDLQQGYPWILIFSYISDSSNATSPIFPEFDQRSFVSLIEEAAITSDLEVEFRKAIDLFTKLYLDRFQFVKYDDQIANKENVNIIEINNCIITVDADIKNADRLWNSLLSRIKRVH